MATVTYYRSDYLKGYTVDENDTASIDNFKSSGYTTNYEQALRESKTTVGGINYTAPTNENNSTVDSTTLTPQAKKRIKDSAKLKFGNSLPEELIEEYTNAYIEFGNDADSAIATVRQTDLYKTLFPGNLNADGATVKFSESEYTSIQNSYKRRLENININPDVILTEERRAQLIENVVSPDEFGQRINTVRTNVLNAIPQVKEFYLRNFNRVLTDEEIIASAIDPEIGKGLVSGTLTSSEILNQQIRTARIGAETLLAGTDISIEAAEELSNLGLSVEKARRGFAQVRTIQQQALAQGRDVPSVQDILEGTELGQQEELSTVMNIMNQQQTQSSVSLGAVQGQTGAVTGLLEG